MSKQARPAVVVVVALGLALGSALGCAGKQPPPGQPAAAPPPAAGAPALAKVTAGIPEGPPVTLMPAATARPFLEVAISITSLDQLLARGAALAARAVPLPVDPAGLRDMLLQQAGLAPEIAANLDLASPSGVAVVALDRPGTTGLVMAVAARGPAEAERVIGALGKTVMKRGAVVLVDNGTGGRGWVFRAGNVVVLSDEIDALARGAMLALEARHPAPDDVTAVIYPETIARAHGTDVKTALSGIVELMRSAQAAQPPPARTSPQAIEMMAEMVALAGDVDTVEAGLAIDNNKGLALRVRLNPRPATPLTEVIRESTPFELNHAVLNDAKPPPVVAAGAYGPFTRKLMAQQRERLAAGAAKKEKGAASALAVFDAFLATFAGRWSLAMSFVPETPYFSGDFVYALKDAASAAKLAAAFGKMDRAGATALWNAQIGETSLFEIAMKKESAGKLKAQRYTIKLAKVAEKAAAKSTDPTAEMMRKFFGNGIDVYSTVSDTRLIGTVGKGAKARLASLAAGKSGTPQGVLADTLALASSARRETFFFMDLAPIMGLVAASTGDPRAAAVARSATTPITIYGTSGAEGGGKTWSMDLTFPPSAFAGAGAIIRTMSTPPAR